MKRMRKPTAGSLRFPIYLLLLLMTGCIDPIQVTTDRQPGQVVIDGFVTDGPGPHKVRVARTEELAQITTPERGALVFLRDGAGNSEILNEQEPGIYVHNGNVLQPEAGKAYFVEVILANGARYATIPDTMPTVVGQDSAWFTKGSERGSRVVNVWASSQLPASEKPLFIRWYVEEVYQFSPTDFPDPFNTIPPSCYVFDAVEPQRMNLYDGARFRTRSIEAQKVGVRQFDDTFRERHFFNVYQRSLSEPAFRYWEQVEIVANQTGSIFDLPPAPVRGNAFRADSDEQVLGFFACIKEDTTRFDTYPGDFEFRTSDPCNYDAFKRLYQYPDECLDCLILEGSTYAKPPYFY